MTKKEKIAKWNVEMDEWEEKVRNNPEAPVYAYWQFRRPPKDKLPKVGEEWRWQWKWPEGEISERHYRIHKVEGAGGKYPRVTLCSEHGDLTTSLLRKLGGYWEKMED